MSEGENMNNNKDCPYCKIAGPPIPTIHLTHNTEEKNQDDNVLVFIDWSNNTSNKKKTWMITAYTPDEYHSTRIQINYCPICGRKLNN